MYRYRKEQPKPMRAVAVSVAKRERESIDRNVREVDARRDLRATTDASDFVTAMLTASNVSYKVIQHDKEYTSLKTASKAHVCAKGVGKGILVRLHKGGAVTPGGSLSGKDPKQAPQIVMCILRATDKIQLPKVAKLMHAEAATLCPESEALIANHKLPLEAGAVPPLPDIYGVEGLLDQALAAEDDIIFKAGNNSQLIQMSMMDFRTLSPITLGSFTEEMDVHLRDLTHMLTRVSWKVGNCIIRHEPAATASEAAKAVHFPGACCLKAVLVRLDGDYGLCAIPANRCVDLQALAKLAEVKEACLASAVELRERIPAAQSFEREPEVADTGSVMQHGPLPPFGNLFGMTTYVDIGTGFEGTSGAVDVAFSAGTVTESMSMRYGDYIMVLRSFQTPVLGSFTVPAPSEVLTWASAQYRQHLKGQGVQYYTLKHSRTYTAAETAAEARVSGHKMAKTVVVTNGEVMALAVVRACDMLHLAALSCLVGSQAGTSKGGTDSAQFRLAAESEFADIFENVEAGVPLGAMPPFGHLHGMPTYVDSRLAQCGTIFMNAGNHKELLVMSWESYSNLVKPIIGDIAMPASSPKNAAASAPHLLQGPPQRRAGLMAEA